MKIKMSSFVAGMVAMLLISALSVTALAASGAINLTVHNINIKVDGEIFKPKDVNGKDVLVFAYDGTTYAPLRALAEAYDLEVGYDAKENLATVSKPDSTPATPSTPDSNTLTYEQFKAMWKPIYLVPDEEDGGRRGGMMLTCDDAYDVVYNGSLDKNRLKTLLNAQSHETLNAYSERFVKELWKEGRSLQVYFSSKYGKLGADAIAADGSMPEGDSFQDFHTLSTWK